MSDTSGNDTKSDISINDNGITQLSILYFKKHFGCCPGIKKYTLNDFTTIYDIITHLNTLDTYQKNIVLVRFNRICLFIKREYFYIKHCYTLSKVFIIITGIINPALLSINIQTDTSWYLYIYWLVWTIQVLVSLVTALSSFYKWDKKYFTFKAYKTKIEQELWLYLELIGRYSILNKKCEKETALNRTTHETKLNLFLFRLEYLFKRLKDADLEIEITDDDQNKDPTAVNNKAITILPHDHINSVDHATALLDETDTIDGGVPNGLLFSSKILPSSKKSETKSHRYTKLIPNIISLQRYVRNYLQNKKKSTSILPNIKTNDTDDIDDDDIEANKGKDVMVI